MIRTPFMVSVLATILASLPFSAQSQSSPPLCSADPEQLKQRDQLVIENQLRDETLRKELAAVTAELTRVKTTTELERVRVDGELVRKRNEVEKARVEMEQISIQAALENARRQAEMQTQ